MRIVIITSGQPYANPRVVKEASALANFGNEVTVIYAPLSPWADQLDQELFKKLSNIRWVRVGYHSLQQPKSYKLARLRRKLYEWLALRVPALSSPEKAFVLFSQELRSEAVKTPADLYIAHNVGALPAAVAAAKKSNSFCAFDAEDFHRGEDKEGSFHYNTARAIEDKYLPKVDYLTTASPLISEAYQALYPGKNVSTINNVFSKEFLQPFPTATTDGLSLFWFSQTIGANRGLETIIEAVNKLPSLDISLHLLGSCSTDYQATLMALNKEKSRLHFYPPSSLETVFNIASRFDVGIASEVPYCKSRDLCLTNKLFTYLLAGNYILASNTAAQQQFLNTYPQVGSIYDHNNLDGLCAQLTHLHNNKQEVLEAKRQAYHLAATQLNWEQEALKLRSSINLIQPTIEKNSSHIPSLSSI